MKILLVEDSNENIKLAQEQLSGHELVIAKNFTEASLALYNGKDAKGNARKVEQQKFDVLLTDMNMPLGSTKMPWNYRYIHDESLCNTELPYGAMICLLALQNKVKKICIVTDGDHHHSPTTAALTIIDSFSRWAGKDRLVKIQTIKDWESAINSVIN